MTDPSGCGGETVTGSGRASPLAPRPPLAGPLLEKRAEHAFREPARVGLCLILFSGVMLWADRKQGAGAWRRAGAR